MGNSVSRRGETAAGVCEISSIAAHTVQCSNEVHVQRGLWQNWKDFNNHFVYYIYRVGLHHVICIQRSDTKVSLAIDLVVNHVTKTWHIRVREVEWKPGSRTVCKSKHTWHAAAALKAIQAFAKNFDNWTIIANNCSTFAKGVVGFMADSEKRAEYDCEPITDDFDRLSSLGATIGVELMYMTSKEALESIPSQDEEQIDDNLGDSDVSAATGGEEDRHRELVIDHEQVKLSTLEKKDDESMIMNKIEKINNE